MVVATVCGEEMPGLVVEPVNAVELDNVLVNTDLLMAFVVGSLSSIHPKLLELKSTNLCTKSIH